MITRCGMAFVTTILIPALRRSGNDYALFEKLEHRFGLQAKFSTQIVLISGLAMLYLSNAWSRLADTWWLWAMIVTWGIFTLMLFVLEPWLIHGWLKRKAQLDSAAKRCACCSDCITLYSRSVCSPLVLA
ncbi:hypothetical protein [Deefgea sp. CFH1-16]|uniref:hypothetical protein n=1 Tax=Deefgea sp. CFH1-16 TaxID=2675457 RepID=UPI0015F71F58|nr:hypothetical protein [Deefgea sp. CFH1-16]MBM5574252.1 hypothetical protein [Deefgea sp. CFH1-16]